MIIKASGASAQNFHINVDERTNGGTNELMDKHDT